MSMPFHSRVGAMEDKARALYDLVQKWITPFDTAEYSFEDSRTIYLTPHATTALSTKSALLQFGSEHLSAVYSNRCYDIVCRFLRMVPGTTPARSSFAVILISPYLLKSVFCKRRRTSIQFIQCPRRKLLCGHSKISFRQFSTSQTNMILISRTFSFV